jgi:DNA-binding response OmpR family regulator
MQDILVVEDGLHERERLKKLFQQSNFSVSVAESVKEAEKLLDIDEFRLVVLDIGLGDKSGSHLFELIKRSSRVPYVIVLTGNPSIHLKQRFLEEGAVDYIVKASPQAENDSLLNKVKSLLGTVELESVNGIPLADFLRLYLTQSSRELFLDSNNSIAPCSQCGSNDYTVTFAHKTQLPPIIEGKVLCTHCDRELDPEVG